MVRKVLKLTVKELVRQSLRQWLMGTVYSLDLIDRVQSFLIYLEKMEECFILCSIRFIFAFI